MTGQWQELDVPTMWLSANAASTETAWTQVRGWQATHDLLIRYADDLKLCRNELEATWPPSKSPAAQAFVTYLDGLIGTITTAAETAAVNQGALHRVIESLESTKVDLAEINQSWLQLSGVTSMGPANPLHLLALGPAQTWQNVLTSKARARMFRNDVEIQQATDKMVPPDVPKFGGRDEFVDLGDGSGDGTGGRVDHGSISPFRAESASGREEAHIAGSVAGTATVGSSVVQPAPGGSHAAEGVTQRPVNVPVIGAPAGGHVPGAGYGGMSNIGRVGSTGPVPAPSTFGAGAAPRGGQRASAPGGVIGGQATGAPIGPSVGGGARGGAGSRRLRPERDPYQIWTVDEGVPPVIEAPQERPHDPGPGVIGIDR